MNVCVELEEGAVMPEKAHEYDAAFDCYTVEEVKVEPGQTVAVSLGFRLALPVHYEAQIRPRSGLSLRSSIDVVLGTVDSNYRGVVKAIVRNRNLDAPFWIDKHMRICQMVIQELPVVRLTQVDAVDTNTERGENGFGSTSI